MDWTIPKRKNSGDSFSRSQRLTCSCLTGSADRCVECKRGGPTPLNIETPRLHETTSERTRRDDIAGSRACGARKVPFGVIERIVISAVEVVQYRGR